MEQLQPEEEEEVGEDGLTDEEIVRQINVNFCDDLETYHRGKNTTILGDALTTLKTKKTTTRPKYATDSFNRFKPYRLLKEQLLSSLLLTGTLQEGSLFPVSVRHLTEQHYRWIIERQDRRDFRLHRCYPSLEKLDFPIAQVDGVHARLWLQVLTHQQQLRAIKVVSIGFHIWSCIMWFTMKYYRQPLLRHLHSLMLGDDFSHFVNFLNKSKLTEKEIELLNEILSDLIDLLVQYAPQLKHLAINNLHPWILRNAKFPKLPCIKSLQIALATKSHVTLATEYIFDKSMPTLECLSLKLYPEDFTEEMVLFELLYAVPNLKKLQVMMSHVPEVKKAVFAALRRSVDKLKAKLSTEQARVWKVEVLSIFAQFDPEAILALFEPFFHSTLQKLELLATGLLQLNLDAFTALRCLTLYFGFTEITTRTTTVFRHVHNYDRIQVLTIVNLSPITHLLIDCFGQAFTQLTELNVGSNEGQDYCHLIDLKLSEVLTRSLRNLTILRFTDDYTKGALKETIKVMYKRAEELKVPVLLRVPLGAYVMKNLGGQLPTSLPTSKYFKLF